jgi:amino acid transporter
VAEPGLGGWTGLPAVGLDALASAAYGPEAALTVLLPLGAAGLGAFGVLTALTLGLLGLVAISYGQAIVAYPGGGGSYTVARENLGERAGQLAAAALVLDYVLNVAVGISAGVGALVSALPGLTPFTLPLTLLALGLLTLVNLRGVRASGLALLAPTYAFLATLGGVLLLGLVRTVLAGGHPTPVEAPPLAAPPAAVASAWLLLRAFATGCTALTGVEAVSNAVPLFRAPSVPRALRTHATVAVLLGALVAGVAALCVAYGVTATAPGTAGYQSVLSQLVAAVVGRGVAYAVTLGVLVAVLTLSANTSFADFPRLCRVLAEDRYLPASLGAPRSGPVPVPAVLLLAGLSALLLLAFGGITDRLIPLFAIGALLAFTLSQAGMAGHWRRAGGHRAALTFNAAGAALTGLAAAVVAAAGFLEGAWLAAVLLAALVAGFARVKARTSPG